MCSAPGYRRLSPPSRVLSDGVERPRARSNAQGGPTGGPREDHTIVAHVRAEIPKTAFVRKAVARRDGVPLLVFLPIESVEAVTSALASLSRQRSRGVVSKAAVHGNAAVQISRLSASVHQRKARHTYFTYRSVAVRVSVLVLHEQVSKWLRCQGQRGSLPLPGARRPSRMISTSRGQRPLAGPTVA